MIIHLSIHIMHDIVVMSLSTQHIMRKTAIESGVYGTLTYRDAPPEAKHIFKRVDPSLLNYIMYVLRKLLCIHVGYSGM